MPNLAYYITMAEMFTMKRKDFDGLQRFFKQSPAQFKAAARSVLNSFAFGTKEETFTELNRKLKIRSPGFVRSSIRVTMAKGSNISSMFSETYTLKRRNFSGWAEQERGQRTSLNRTISKFARGGSWQGKVRSRFRLKPSNEFFDPERFSGRSYEHRVMKMLGAMRTGRSIRKRPYIIRHRLKGGLSTMKRGTYGWQGKQTQRLQNFEKRTQPKKIQIMKNARLNYFRKTNIISIWGREIDRIINRYR